MRKQWRNGLALLLALALLVSLLPAFAVGVNAASGQTVTPIDDDYTGDLATITYTGTWLDLNGRPTTEYDQTIHTTNEQGASFEVSFTGSGIVYYAGTNSANRGLVRFYLDGKDMGTVDCAVGTGDAFQVRLFEASHLTAGAHVLKGVHEGSGAYYMDTDRFDLYTDGDAPTNGTVLNDDYTGSLAAIRYTGSWAASANRQGTGEYNADIHSTTVSGDCFEVSFNGTGIEYYTDTDAANRGAVEIYLDGAYKGTVNLAFGETTGFQYKAYGVYGLESGQHTLKGVAVLAAGSTKYFDVDCFKLFQNLHAEAPTASVTSGTVASGTEVALSTATEGAVIHYTTDGSTPTAASAVYSEPIVITANTTVRAVAVKEGIDDSAVAVFQYRLPVSAASDYDVSNYDLEWTSHSNEAWDSMPAGNGSIGVNVWTVEGGDLLFYISKINAIDGDVYGGNTQGEDAASGNANVLKLGRIRVHFDGNPFKAGNSFSQKLELENGRIVLRAADSDSELVNLNLWVDAKNPVIHLNGTSASGVTVTLETWRNEQTVDDLADSGKSEVVYNDAADNQLVWYHRNVTSTWQQHAREQGTTMTDAELAAIDPVLNLTFGCAMSGTGMTRTDARTLTQAAGKVDLAVTVLGEQAATAQKWFEDLTAAKTAATAVAYDAAYAAHQAWWTQYWNRSYIELLGGTSDAYSLTQNYILQRYVSGCSTTGETLSHFNGSIFSVDVEGSTGKSNFFGEIKQNLSPDFKAWSATMFMMQNTRHIYEPLAASGDYDGMKTLVDYLYKSLPFMIARNKARFGGGTEYKGIMIFENSTVGGLGGTAWNASHLINNHTPTIEMPYLALQYYRFSGDKDTLEKEILPVADAALDFFDLAFPKKDGKIVLSPSGGAETVVDATNPTTTVAGLRALLQELLELDSSLTTAAERAKYTRMLSEVPEISTIDFKGQSVVDVAQDYTFAQTSYRDRCETVNLYSIYPFRQYMTGSSVSDLALARRTYQSRWDLHADEQPGVTMGGTYGGWSASELSAALLGFPQEAGEMLTNMGKQTCPKWSPAALQGTARFPAFWGPYFDWMPDQDHGGNYMNMFQSMLVTQDQNRNIYLLNAWPENWDVRFKLHADGAQTITGSYINGKLTYKVDNPDSKYTVCDCSGVNARIQNIVDIACNDYNYTFGKDNIQDTQYTAANKANYTVSGAWMEKYAESVSGTHAGQYELGDWGGSTYNPTTGTLYLHITKSNWNGTLTLPTLSGSVTKATVLTGGTAAVTNSASGLTVKMDDAAKIDPLDTIIKLEGVGLAGAGDTEKLVKAALAAPGKYTLDSAAALKTAYETFQNQSFADDSAYTAAIVSLKTVYDALTPVEAEVQADAASLAKAAGASVSGDTITLAGNGAQLTYPDPVSDFTAEYDVTPGADWCGFLFGMPDKTSATPWDDSGSNMLYIRGTGTANPGSVEFTGDMAKQCQAWQVPGYTGGNIHVKISMAGGAVSVDLNNGAKTYTYTDSAYKGGYVSFLQNNTGTSTLSNLKLTVKAIAPEAIVQARADAMALYEKAKAADTAGQPQAAVQALNAALDAMKAALNKETCTAQDIAAAAQALQAAMDGLKQHAITPATPVTPSAQITPATPTSGLTFLDVADGDWFRDSVYAAAEAGLMNGVGDQIFDPNGDTTRGMIMTILYRLAGSPDKTGQGAWYDDARAWAMKTGVSDGTNVMQKITREQLAAMLWRYAGKPAADLTKLDGFADGAKVSAYAKEAVAWAIETGILTGRPGKLLDPQGFATRAETAAMFVRFSKLK